MNRATLWAVALLTLTLSGCLGGGDDEGETDTPVLSAADCEAQGLELGTDDAGGPACVEPVPPATVDVDGLPDTIAVYTDVAFTWTLHTDAEESHTVRTEVRFSTERIADEDLGNPDDWGTSAGTKEHQNFVDGQSYDGTWTTDTPGTYYFRAYAVVEATNIWGPEHAVTVTEVQPTGTTETVTATGCGLPGVGGLDPADLTITLGDAVSWTSGDPDTYAIASTGGPVEFTTTTGGDVVVFTVPGSYTYGATGTLGTCSGTIAVTA